MAKTISRYKVDFLADTSKYDRPLNKAGKSTKGFGSTVRGAGKALGKATLAIGAMGAAAAAAGISIGVMLTKSGMADIDRITKFADSIGHSTEMMSGLEFSAGLAGASAEKLQTGMRKLTDVFSRAAAGEKRQIEMFTDMGLSVEKLQGMNADERFLTISDAIAGMKNPTDQARAAIDLFGKSGTDLINLVRQGSDALKGQQDEAAKLGLVFDREAAAKVEMANDAMSKMGALATGLGRTLAVQLAPYVTALAETVTGFATDGRSTGDIIVDAFEWVAKAIAKASSVVDLFKATFHALQTGATKAVKLIIDGLGALIKGIDKASEALGLGVTGLGETIKTYSDELDYSAEESAEKMGEAWDNFANGTRTKKVEAFFKKVRDKADDAAAATAEAAEERANFSALAQEAAAEAEAAQQEQQQEEQQQQQQQAQGSPKAQATPSATSTAVLAGSAQAFIAQKRDEIKAIQARKKREQQLDAVVRRLTDLVGIAESDRGDVFV